MKTLVKLLAFAIFLGVVIFPITALASSNAGQEAYGEGASPISGWTVSNLNYQLSDQTAQVTSVTFDLDAPAGQVSVKLISTGNDYATCTNVAAYHWQCNFPAGVDVSNMDEFRVVAVGN